MTIRVCVYGSSSNKTPIIYQETAYKLGELIADKKLICVNGAGKYGVMGNVSKGCKSKNGYVIGVMHELFSVDGIHESPLVDEFVLSKGNDLNERKQLLIDHSDCFIALPGGTGTFEEFWEIVSEKTLNFKGLSHKPICLLNINGYYDGFILQLQRAFDDSLLYHKTDEYFYVANSPEEALEWCIDTYNSNESNINNTLKTTRVHTRSKFNNVNQLFIFASLGFLLGFAANRYIKI